MRTKQRYLTNKLLLVTGLTAGNALAAAPALASTSERPPNILWIEADDLMPRFMHKLGDGFGYTPNLDRLAEQGIYFPNAICTAPMCAPSRNGLLTNRYSHNLGFYRNGNMRLMPKGIWTFPRVLQQAGYYTAYIGKSHMRPPQENPKASKNEALKFYGFDYANSTGERYMLWKLHKKGKNISRNPFIKHLKKRGKYEQWVKDNTGYGHLSTMEDDIDYLDGYTADVACRWLREERPRDKPLFMWYCFCLPHGPYDVPQRWYDKVADIKIPPPKTDKFGHPVPEPLLKGNKPIKSKKAIMKDRRGEVANVAFMDAMIGKLLDTLRETGELDNTIIFFFSDHSIFLGNHGRMHKLSLFEEPLALSLIISYPARFKGDRIVDNPVEIMDLVPTLFDLAGIKDAEKVARNGFSLVPLLEGKRTFGRRYAFAEIGGAQSVSDERYRYITSEGMDILYDHKNDPWEMKNVASELPEITKHMREVCRKYYHNTGEILPPKTY